jgi:hypothetical protein
MTIADYYEIENWRQEFFLKVEEYLVKNNLRPSEKYSLIDIKIDNPESMLVEFEDTYYDGYPPDTTSVEIYAKDFQG